MDQRKNSKAPPAQGRSLKNPEREADAPGGTPSNKVKGSATPHPRDPEGQQGATGPAGN